MYYGASRELSRADVIITSYGIVSFEHRDQVGVHSRSWRRIILDEAHVIRNRNSDVSAACCALDASRRWCLTGTPIQNNVDDIYPLVRFLRFEPWSNRRWWNRMMNNSKTTTNAETPNEFISKIRDIMTEVMLRRKKTSIDATTGKPIIDLPPKHVHIVKCQLTDEERQFYAAMEKRSAFFMQRLTQKNSYAILFSILLRLRQACDHPLLVTKALGVVETDQKKRKAVSNASALSHSDQSEYMDSVLRRLEDSWTKGSSNEGMHITQ